MEKIDNINWEVYDLLKLAENSDRQNFSFKDWEVDFILEKVREIHPEYSEVNVLRAILTCCKRSASPHEKREFVKQIISVLENQ